MSTIAFLGALVLICFLYWVIGSLYVATNREIKRIDVSSLGMPEDRC